MTPLVVVPVPMDTPEVWELFRPFVQRFCDTLRKYDAGWDYGLVPVVNHSEPTDEILEMFKQLPTNFISYDGNGADIGSFQKVAEFEPDAFLVCCVSRVYFHCDDWLKKIMEARQDLGPGLYGTCASREGGTLHVCTRCYAMDARLFNEYPVRVTSRDQGTFWEIGRKNPDGPLSEWVASQKCAVKVVYRSGAYDKSEWFIPPNTFRTGNQSNLLVLDKHSDAYAKADTEEKQRLEKLMRGAAL